MLNYSKEICEMYQVSWYFNKVDNGYEFVRITTHELYLFALTDAIIEWFMNSKVKLRWERNVKILYKVI